MAFWAIVTGYGTATIQVGAAGKPGPWVRMPALISYLLSDIFFFVSKLLFFPNHAR